MKRTSTDSKSPRIGRRRLLGRAAAVAAGGATVAVVGLPAGAAAGDRITWARRRVAIDIAYLGHKERYTPIPPFPGVGDWLRLAELGQGNNGFPRAWLTYREGHVFEAGTIPDGALNWDPASPAATEARIGTIFSRGWFVEEVPGRNDPQAVTTHEYILGEISADRLFPSDQLVSSGLEFVHADERGPIFGGMGTGWYPGRPEQAGLRSVIGGTGQYAGATGVVTQSFLGTNNTAAEPVFSHNAEFGHTPRNYRFEFQLTVPTGL